MASKPHVVIIGAGFAGVHAARRLKKVPVSITVVDRGTSHLFQPLLYQCATGVLSEGAITSPIRHLLRRQRNVNVVLGEADDIDVAAKVLTVLGADGSPAEISYDYLVVGTGMRTAYHGCDDAIENSIGMKTLDDALAIRRQVLGAFEIAETLTDPEERRKWLTFAVAGAGPTGVEIAGQIRELATLALGREFDSIDPTEARVLLFHGADRILPSFTESLSKKAQRTLDKIGVETHLGVHVVDVGEDTVTTKDKKTDETTTYKARTTLWTAGVEAVPFARTLAKALGVEADRSGRIPVRDDLSVEGHPEVFVAGDTSSLNKLPGVAEVAMQGGRHVGGVIADLVAGQSERKPFKYHDLGNAAYIARRNAIVQSGPLEMSGTLGWLAWGVIHVAFLAGVRNRMGALVTWSATLITGTRSERAITYGDPRRAHQPYPDE